MAGYIRGDVSQLSDITGKPAAPAHRRSGQANYGRITVMLNAPALAAAWATASLA
ncbi:hypothetical protein SAMN05216330_102304 [Bradyrhizobium sp. Ghvi]|nr:hypothetical protein SAMN05216330_102304 [Bradyrhizobium sp. Ghvi]